MLSHVRYGFETIDKESFFKLIFKAGLGKIRHVLHDVEILDWDTNCWIVEMNSGEIKALTQIDATFCEVSAAKLMVALNRTKLNFESLERAVASISAASQIS